MDQFNVVPFLLGLALAAIFGTASGLLGVRGATGRQVGVNPIGQDAGALPAMLFWLGFVLAVLGGLYGISSRSAWLGILIYLLIAAISATAVALPARAIRQRHNRAPGSVTSNRDVRPE